MPAVPSTLRALLSDLVDYAGLFPPARLPLEEAFPLFARHLQAPEAWMLARFVLPAARLSDLAALAGERPEVPYRLALLGTGGATGAAFLRGTAADLEALHAFAAEHPGFATLDAFEVALPGSVQTEGGAAEVIARVADIFAQVDRAQVPVFFEVPFSPAGLDVRPHLLAALQAHNDGGGTPFGLKLRTGGTSAERFPPPEALADALVEAHRAGVPFKATAGLHHPVRHYRDEVETHMHGFLNVFGGAVLLHTHDLDAETLAALLRDEDATAFQITDETFSYRDLSASTAEVAAARKTFARSFGSCSFEEPVEDLRAMGWLA